MILRPLHNKHSPQKNSDITDTYVLYAFCFDPSMRVYTVQDIEKQAKKVLTEHYRGAYEFFTDLHKDTRIVAPTNGIHGIIKDAIAHSRAESAVRITLKSGAGCAYFCICANTVIFSDEVIPELLTLSAEDFDVTRISEKSFVYLARRLKLPISGVRTPRRRDSGTRLSLRKN